MDERFERERFGRRYDDEERRFGAWRPDDYESRQYRREAYEGHQPGRSRSEYGRPRRGEDRGILERLADELRSWFGEESTERRGREDERESRWGGTRTGSTRGRDWEDVDEREWARQWGYVDRSSDRGRAREERPWSAERGWTGRDLGLGGSSWGSGERGWGEGRRRDDERWSERGYGTGGYDIGPGVASEVWMTRGPYTGRGPRGYQRSDERIKEDVCERLSQNGQLDASDIDIVVVSGEVTLQGQVPNRGDKRLAEDIAESVTGVREVNNQLRTGQSRETGQQRGQEDWRNRAA